MSSTSLENEIQPFIDEDFSAEAAAQDFFASYGEADINIRLDDLSGVQRSIEGILKEKVRNNYGMFLQATELIHKVGVEMADLKHIVDNTQKLINDVRSTRLAESRAMRCNSLLPALQMMNFSSDEETENQANEEKTTSKAARRSLYAAEKSKLPGWIVKAPDDLAKHIVEQQYSLAVAIVLRTRTYGVSIQQSGLGIVNRFSKPDGNSNGSPDSGQSAVIDILRNVNERSIHLAYAIKSSLQSLPNSQLWGSTERQKRLKLLVALGEFNMAAESFSNTYEHSIQRVLTNAESATLDLVSFSEQISKNFFVLLVQVCESFFSLFGEHCENPSNMTLLLAWLQQQVTQYVAVFARQIHLGINECSAVIVMKFRQLSVLSTVAASPVKYSLTNSSKQRSNTTPNTTDEVDETPSSEEGSDGQLRRTLTSESLPKYIDDLGETEGALSLTSRCLEMAFAEASRLDVLKLQGKSCLGWILLPELKKFITAYAEEFIKEISVQVRQDPWIEISPRHITVQEPYDYSYDGFNEATRGNASDSKAQEEQESEKVSCSYDWLSSVVTNFCEELWILVKGNYEEHVRRMDVSTKGKFEANKDQFYSESNDSLGESEKVYGVVHPFASMDVQDRAMSQSIDRSSSLAERNLGSSTLDPMPTIREDLAISTHNMSSDEFKETNQKCSTPEMYNRADVCEVEPTAVSCLLRMVLRYLVELEATETKGFTTSQRQCFIKTLKAFSEKFLPSLQDILSRYFFSASMSNSHSSPQLVFRTTSQRIAQLMQEVGE